MCKQVWIYVIRFQPLYSSDFSAGPFYRNTRETFRKSEAREKKLKPGSSVLCWAEINVTSFKGTLFCLEIHEHKGNEWPVALIAKSFGARETAAPQNASQRDERIEQQLHKACQRKCSLCCLEKIRTELDQLWGFSQGQMIAVTCCSHL